MIRLHIIAEGQTEEAFVNELLTPHLGHFNISTSVHYVTTNQKQKQRGGLKEYSKAKRDRKAKQLIQICNNFQSPELINDGEITAPSKRILQLIPTYNKISDGIIIAQKIGLAKIREKCPHFNQWLTQLENL